MRSLWKNKTVMIIDEVSSMGLRMLKIVEKSMEKIGLVKRTAFDGTKSTVSVLLKHHHLFVQHSQ